jgi:hypothetical protein
VSNWFVVGIRDKSIFLVGPYEYPEEAMFSGRMWERNYSDPNWLVKQGPFKIYQSDDENFFERKDN